MSGVMPEDVEGRRNEQLNPQRKNQQCLPKLKQSNKIENKLALTFSKLMIQGKTKAALRLIAEHNNGRVLHSDDTVPSDTTEVQSVTS